MPWQPKMNVRFFSILWFMLLRDVTCIVCLCVRQFDLKWLIEWGFDIEAYIVTNWYDDRFHARYTCAINVECFFEWVVMNIKIKWLRIYHLNMVCERKMYVFIAEYVDCEDQPFELIIIIQWLHVGCIFANQIFFAAKIVGRRSLNRQYGANFNHADQCNLP